MRRRVARRRGRIWRCPIGRFSKLLIVATVMAAVVVPTSAVSASTTINFNLVGAEYAANFGESSLSGVAAST